MDLRFTELLPVSQIVVNECLKVKPGEKVLLLTDTRAPDFYGVEPQAQALFASLRLAGCDPIMMTWNTRAKHGMKVPSLAAEAIAAADVVIVSGTSHFIQDPAYYEARKKGTRFMTMPQGLNVERVNDMIYRTMPQTVEEFRELAALTKRIGDAFIGGTKTIHVTTEKGTDVPLQITDELGQSVCTGECDKPGDGSFLPAGQFAFGVKPGSANGTIVVDASIHPIKHILTEPIIFEVKDNNIVSVTGGEDAAAFRQVLVGCPYPGRTNVAEFGLGCNPITQIIGNSFEDECFYGSAHFGFGSNMGFGGDVFTDNFHCDGVFVNATIEVDGKVVCENGQFIPELTDPA